MRKQLIALALVLAFAAVVVACGHNADTTGYVEPAVEETTIAETTSELSTETALQAAESESAVQTEAAASFSAGTITQTAATSSAQAKTTTKTAPAAATQATTRTTAPTTQRTTTTTRSTSTTRSTTTTTTAAPKPQTQPQKPVYTEADYAEIVAAVRKYTESKVFPFIWDTTLTYEYAQSGRAGFHDVVNLSLYGKAFVISELENHCDLTEWLVTGGSGGVPSTEVHYNIVWLQYQGDTMFILIYG